MNKLKKTLINLISIAIFAGVTLLVVSVVSNNGLYPEGSDTMYHIFRGDQLYKSILEGNYYPLINFRWYNGVELMRYWAPLCAYVMAGTEAIFAGDMMKGYVCYVGIICFFSALSWLHIGNRTNRPVLGAALGILWFFMPNNLTALFVEGNLPRSLSMVFLPILIFSIYQYFQTEQARYLLKISISFTLVVLCHLGYAGMVALAILLFLLVDKIVNRRKMAGLRVIEAILLGFALPGIWLLPSLVGGISGVDSSETMAGFFQSIFVTLNPILRITEGFGAFYFGLAAFLLAVAGIFLGRKNVRAGFLTAVIIAILTTNTMYKVIKLLPGSQYMWMLRFISIALCFILIEFINWKSLKRVFVILFFLLMVLDTYPSLRLLEGNGSGISAEARLDKKEHELLLDSASEYTYQRLALIDESDLGSMGAFLVSDWNNPMDGTYGAGWEAANTSSNIMQINYAMHDGDYSYVFDRCLELGNDTVLVRLQNMNAETTIDDLDNAAAASGYSQVAGNTYFRLYSLEGITGNWGVKTEYSAIGIGNSATTISRLLPLIKETSDSNINHYSFEELSKYKLVYLSDFTYDDKESAEDLVLKLSEAGVKIVIVADGIPESRVSHDRSFLGAVCSFISFSQGYPILVTDKGELDTDFFPSDHINWNTVFINGMDKVLGTVEDNTYDIPFYGTVKNDNIVMIGLNLVFYNSITRDEATSELLRDIFDVDEYELPTRQILPLQISRSNNAITIESPEDDVETTFAYHDIFKSEQAISEYNNLLYVNKGTTVITYSYPYLYQGAAVSIVAAILLILFVVFANRTQRKKI